MFAGGTDWAMVRISFSDRSRESHRSPPTSSSSSTSCSTSSLLLLSFSLSHPNPPPPSKTNIQIGRQAAGASKKASTEEQAAEAERSSLYPSLPTPVRLAALDSVPVAFVAAGPSAMHCLVGAVDGRLFTWGRNEKGQLGHGE